MRTLRTDNYVTELRSYPLGTILNNGGFFWASLGHISSNELYSKILKESFIVQK